MSRGQSQRIAVRAAVVGQGNLHGEAAKRWSGAHLRVEDRQAADEGRDERSGEPELERSLATAAAEHQGVAAQVAKPGAPTGSLSSADTYPLCPEGSVLGSM